MYIGVGRWFRGFASTFAGITPTYAVGPIISQGKQNGREFDAFDIVANICGSLAAVAICLWYHKRMMERKRTTRAFDYTPGEGDLELGEDMGAQETGVTGQSLNEEVDNWDENDWEEDEPVGTETEGDGQKTPPSSTDEPIPVPKRRND
jgi:hypothetical protein